MNQIVRMLAKLIKKIAYCELLGTQKNLHSNRLMRITKEKIQKQVEIRALPSPNGDNMNVCRSLILFIKRCNNFYLFAIMNILRGKKYRREFIHIFE